MRIKCLAKENKQCPQPGLEPRLLDPDLNADTRKLPHLHRDYNSQYVVQLKAELWPGSVNCFLDKMPEFLLSLPNWHTVHSTHACVC